MFFSSRFLSRWLLVAKPSFNNVNWTLFDQLMVVDQERFDLRLCLWGFRQQRKVDGASSPSACAVPRPPRIAAQKPSLLTNPCLETKTSPSLKFWVLTASTSEELLAAATLRAQVFYVYPQLVEKYTEGVEAVKERVAHNFQVADLLKTRTKSEFNRVFRTSLHQQYTLSLLQCT
jgi:hypothetical protein